jgi:hypothetical protein
LAKFGANSVLGDSALTQSGSDVTGSGNISGVILEASDGVRVKGSVSGTIKIVAPATVSSSYTLPLPSAAPSGTCFVKAGASGLSFVPEVPLQLTSTLAAGTIQTTGTSSGVALKATSSSSEAIVASSTVNTADKGTITATNSSNGTAGYFESSGSNGRALQVKSNSTVLSTFHTLNTGAGRAITALRLPASSTAGLTETAIYAASDSSGIAFQGVSANISTDSGTIRAENTSAGNALYAENTTGRAITATSAIAAVGGPNPTAATVHAINTGSGLALFASGGSAGNAINTTGNIKINGTTIIVSSLQIKDVIAPSQDVEEEAVQLFQSIPLSKYTYKESYKSKPKQDGPSYGIIAEHLNEVMPQAVNLEEEMPFVDKNMVFELALVALQNALKRIEVLEAKGA